jgi:C4-type Zn-finger protein
MTNIAQWGITLTVECPNCNESLDILSEEDAADILFGIEILETNAELDLTCSHCGFGFTAETRN